AGKYFNANDTTLSHHIIFTKCGNVEGAENIATYITRGKSYEVKLAYFDDKGDKIIFRDSLDEGVAELFWSVNKDSLILISNTTNSKVKPIILLKK
ncbi:MAG: hypothetical protein JWO03_3213, partial [Bacteroidetes bacterium]|nr:hypothetical protein [Bacteroidota bacterium]